MHWSDTTDLNAKTLQRLVTLLLALAGLAEGAAGRCRAIRWSVLWLLHPGEVIARDYVLALTGDARLAAPLAPGVIVRDADSTADALRLAQAFRTLAAVLIGLLEGICASLQAGIAMGRDPGQDLSAAGPHAPTSHPFPIIERRDSS